MELERTTVDILDSLSLSGNLAPNPGQGGQSGLGSGGPNGPYQARCGAKLANTQANVPNPQQADVLGLGFMVEQVK